MQKLLLTVGTIGLGVSLGYLPEKMSPPPAVVKTICWVIYGLIIFYCN